MRAANDLVTSGTTFKILFKKVDCVDVSYSSTYLRHVVLSSDLTLIASFALIPPCFFRHSARSQRKKFTWDWHAWNMLLVTTPGFVLWAWLHRVEKKMLEDEKLRKEIQERTGVSSRGYLIPPKKLREEATDMIRHNHERPAWSFKTGKASAKAETTTLPQVWGTL